MSRTSEVGVEDRGLADRPAHGIEDERSAGEDDPVLEPDPVEVDDEHLGEAAHRLAHELPHPARGETFLARGAPAGRGAETIIISAPSA